MSDMFDHRSHPPATAMGPTDPDDDAVLDSEETQDGVEELLDPGQPPAPAGD